MNQNVANVIDRAKDKLKSKKSKQTKPIIGIMFEYDCTIRLTQKLNFEKHILFSVDMDDGLSGYNYTYTWARPDVMWDDMAKHDVLFRILDQDKKLDGLVFSSKNQFGGEYQF